MAVSCSLEQVLSSMAHERIAMSGAERMQKSCNRLWAAERALVLGREERDSGLSAAFGRLFGALPKEPLRRWIDTALTN